MIRRIELLVLGLISAGAIACSGNSLAMMPAGPSSLSAAAGSGVFSGLNDSRFPPIVVADGISCPSDAPSVWVGSLDTRLDVEWSPIPFAEAYQIAIEQYDVTNRWHPVTVLEVSRHRVEWHGTTPSVYRLRVRSRMCGDFGAWSAYEIHGIGADPVVTKPEEPGPPPCEYQFYSTGTFRTRMVDPAEGCEDED